MRIVRINSPSILTPSPSLYPAKENELAEALEVSGSSDLSISCFLRSSSFRSRALVSGLLLLTLFSLPVAASSLLSSFNVMAVSFLQLFIHGVGSSLFLYLSTRATAFVPSREHQRDFITLAYLFFSSGIKFLVMRWQRRGPLLRHALSRVTSVNITTYRLQKDRKRKHSKCMLSANSKSIKKKDEPCLCTFLL